MKKRQNNTIVGIMTVPLTKHKLNFLRPTIT